ncbi:MAG: hypothetical protein ABIR29_13830 [Chthoniobacterales bacterium]
MSILLRLATVALLFSAPFCSAAENAAGQWKGSTHGNLYALE